MDNLSIVNFIRNIEIFSGLDDKELDIISKSIKVDDVKFGTFIFTEKSPRNKVYMIYSGKVELLFNTTFGQQNQIFIFKQGDFFGEGALTDDAPHSTSVRTLENSTILTLSRDFFNDNGTITFKVLSNFIRVISRRLTLINKTVFNASEQYNSGKTRKEHDLLGERDVPDDYLFGVQTLRALENFNISHVKLSFYPLFIKAFAVIKMAAAKANNKLGILPDETSNCIIHACQEIIDGKWHNHFAVDMIQGGAGTSMNMNANEVIANRALEIMGHKRGEYQYCHPNNHVNLSQSTNDAYPSAIRIALINSNKMLVEHLKNLIYAFKSKSDEFSDVIKMGRTQLQDAVPMTLGQTFGAYSDTLEEEVKRLDVNAALFLELNMGATAIGTGINSDPEYANLVVKYIRDITCDDYVNSKNLIEATSDAGSYVMYSSTLKRLAVKLSKICNDLRLLSSGPRCGLNEINLPPMQPGSSIMPGKVNPVIPEVMNQVCFKVIGNDLTVTMASEAGQLELNVMEPVIVQSIFESIEMFVNAMDTLKYRCIDGITANPEVCRHHVEHSIGLVTALNPYIGYENSTNIAKEALEKNKSVYELVLEHKLLTKEQLDKLLLPENMVKPHKFFKI